MHVGRRARSANYLNATTGDVEFILSVNPPVPWPGFVLDQLNATLHRTMRPSELE